MKARVKMNIQIAPRTKLFQATCLHGDIALPKRMRMLRA
jgi:hypothetical protein